MERKDVAEGGLGKCQVAAAEGLGHRVPGGVHRLWGGTSAEGVKRWRCC